MSWRIALGLVVLCAAPALAALLGLDLGATATVDVREAATAAGAALREDLAHQALRGSFAHALLESTGIAIALLTVVLAFVHYRIRGDVAAPIIAMALLSAATIDLVLVLAASRLIPAGAPNEALLPFTWTLSRLFTAGILVLCVSLLLVRPPRRAERRPLYLALMAVALTGMAAVAIVVVTRSDALPQTIFPDGLVARPYEAVPLAAFVLLGLFLYPRLHRRSPTLFTSAMILSVVPDIAAQLHVLFGSRELYDTHFNAAHGLRAVAYLVPFTGLALDYVRLHQEGESARSALEHAQRALTERATQLTNANRELEREMGVRQEAEALLLRAKEQAELASRAKGDFLAHMSQEIRTPINGVVVTADQLLESGLDTEQRELVRLSKRSAELLLSTVTDFVDYARAESPDFELDAIPFDLRLATEQAIEVWTPRAREVGLPLTLAWDADTPRRLIGDPSRYRRVLLNLIDNAVKFTKEGQVTVSVAGARLQEPAGEVEIRVVVTDTGPGIPADALDSIFDRFVQVPVLAGDPGGTGLGLAIAREWVTRMGGSIEVRSEVGAGSAFAFRVRLREDAEGDSQPLPAGDLRGVRVLAVEAHAREGKALAEQCIGFGTRPDTCSSGAEALRMLRAAAGDDPYRIVTLGAPLPDVTSEDLATAIRSEPELARTRLALLTAVGQPGDGRRAREAGIHAYLVKPVRADQLEAVLRALLATARDASASELITAHTLRERQAARTVREGQAADTTAAPPPGEIGALRRLAPHVLLADDDDATREALRADLERLGCTVDVARDGRDAVEALSCSSYHLLLLDLGMPVLDGVEAAAAIRADHAGWRMPIVVLASAPTPEDRARSQAAGVDAFLAKPLDPETLLDTLKRFILADD